MKAEATNMSANTTPDKTTDEKKRAYLTREALLLLLTDEEVAKVSAREGGPQMGEGEEYIDLGRPDRGICQMRGPIDLSMSDLLPRRSVGAATWAKLCARLGASV